MNLYRMGYGTFEESDYAILSHDKSFSEEEFHGIVVKAITRVLEGVLSGTYSSECGDRNYVSLSKRGVSYQAIHEFVVKELVEHDGFEEVVYQAKWSVFGWPSLTSDKDWKSQRDEQIDKVFNELPVDLRDKITALGIKTDKEFWAELRKKDKEGKSDG